MSLIPVEYGNDLETLDLSYSYYQLCISTTISIATNTAYCTQGLCVLL